MRFCYSNIISSLHETKKKVIKSKQKNEQKHFTSILLKENNKKASGCDSLKVRSAS